MSNADRSTSDNSLSFAIAFAIATPVLYVLCEMRNWPLVTYHPATNKMDLFWAPPVRGEGPAMYWYGWVLNMLIGGALLAFLASRFPALSQNRTIQALTWIVPTLSVPVLIYAMRYFWRW